MPNEDHTEDISHALQSSADTLERIADALEALPSDTAFLAAVLLSGKASGLQSEAEAIMSAVRAVELSRLIIYLSGQSVGVRTAGDILEGNDDGIEVRRATLRQWVRRYEGREASSPVQPH